MLASEFDIVLEHYPFLKQKFSGCFSSDNIPKSLKLGHFIICNTDSSFGEGKHWYCFSRIVKEEIECFDSLGITGEKYLFLKNCSFGGVKKLIFNKTAFQKDDSTSCGKFVIYYIFERFFNQDIDFHTLLEEIFVKDLNINEQRVERKFNSLKHNG